MQCRVRITHRFPRLVFAQHRRTTLVSVEYKHACCRFCIDRVDQERKASKPGTGAVVVVERYTGVR